MRTLYLAGAGNPEGVRLALRVNEAERRWARILILDDDAAKHGQRLLDVPIAGPFALLAHAAAGDEVANLVARTTRGRAKAGETIAAHGLPWASLVHPEVDTLGVEIGPGVTAYRHATLSANARLGAGSVVFAGANAGHGAEIGPGSVLAPGAVVNARVRLGEGVYVGANASILPDLEIGAWATIGAGSAVGADVPSGATAIGVPAEILGLRTGAPPEDVERAIDGAWRAALGVEAIDPESSFFDLGGSSQAALTVAQTLRRQGLDVGPIDLFRFPSVRRLAAHLAGAEPTRADLRRSVRFHARR